MWSKWLWMSPELIYKMYFEEEDEPNTWLAVILLWVLEFLVTGLATLHFLVFFLSIWVKVKPNVLLHLWLWMWKFVLLEGTGDDITYTQQFHSSPKEKGTQSFPVLCVCANNCHFYFVSLHVDSLQTNVATICCMWDALLTEKVSNIIQEKGLMEDDVGGCRDK